jgi:hypothetical protein
MDDVIANLKDQTIEVGDKAVRKPKRNKHKSKSKLQKILGDDEYEHKAIEVPIGFKNYENFDDKQSSRQSDLNQI